MTTTDLRSPKPQKRRILRRILFALLGIIVAVVLACAALVGYFLLLGSQSVQGQQQRMDELQTTAKTAATEASWAHAADHEIDGELPYDQLRVVATHNSYALQPSWLQRSIIDVVDPGEGALLQYEHAPLWDQLEAGIRSFELDVRWNGTEFVTSHVPLVANRSTVPDFALALEEIRIWSDLHPGHLPLSIMIEPKSDYMFLDPTLTDFDAAAWEALDTVLADGLGEKLFAPDELREHLQNAAATNDGAAADLRAAVRAYGWPGIGGCETRFCCS